MLQLGHTPEHPPNSCAEQSLQNESQTSLQETIYWILNSTQSPVQVFCEMGEVFSSGLTVTGGWVRVANLNMTDPDQQCPENLQLSYTNQPIRLFGRSNQPIQLFGRSTDYDCAHSLLMKFSTDNCVGEWGVTSLDHQIHLDDGHILPSSLQHCYPYVDGVSITQSKETHLDICSCCSIWIPCLSMYEWTISSKFCGLWLLLWVGN